MSSKICLLIPHPDDEVVGCFHFIERLGPTTTIDLIYVTKELSTEMATKRFRESSKATEALVINNYLQWDFPDGNLINHRVSLIQRMTELQDKYDLILCPAPNDKTADHAVLAQVAYNQISLSKLLWYRSTWLTFPLRNADFVVEGKASKKRAALRHYKTQSKLALQNVVSLSTLEARFCGFHADSVEGFRYASSELMKDDPLNVLSLKSLIRLRDWL
ncbi:MAG: PIG-L family deacetylase [Nitrosomonas sp.]|nr:PIG-L family deacetylase [Nitrosomonas sp.]